jgi:hypothetical protein
MLAEGIGWRRKTFGHYLDVLDEKQWMLSVATQPPHAAQHSDARGQDAADIEPSDDQLRRTSDLAREGSLPVRSERPPRDEDKTYRRLNLVHDKVDWVATHRSGLESPI